MQQILRALQSVVIPRLEAGSGALLPPRDNIPLQDGAETLSHDAALHEASSFDASPFDVLPFDASLLPGGFSPAYAGPSRHAYTEILWLLDGEAHIDIAGQIYPLQAGDCCLISPHVPHSEIYDARTPAYRSLWYSHRPKRVGIALFSYQPVGHGAITDYARAPAPPSLAAVLLALQDEMRQGDANSRDAICRPLLLAFSRLLVRTLQEAAERNVGATGETSPGETSPGETSQRVLRLLEEHYSSPLTLGDVARAVLISPSHLATVFKRETGKTIIQTLTEIRLRHACRLLREEHTSVAQTARACGFRSVEHFSRVFRLAEGMSPSRYGK